MTRLTALQIENLPEWMTIPDYPSYEVNCRAGLVRNSRTFRVLNPSINNNGYPIVGLYKDRKLYLKQVHRIVALAAFGYYNIPTDGLLAMHLDEERHNPRIDNLAIGTNKENLNFPKAKQRCCEVQKGKRLSKETRMKISETQKGEKNHWFGKHLSEEHRKKLAEAMKGEKNPNFGKHHSEETKKKMSESRKGEKNHWFGKHLSAEVKKKISEALKGKPNINLTKRVGAYRNGILTLIFNSMALTKVYGFDAKAVSCCCRGKQKSHKGYEWRYFDTPTAKAVLK